MSGLAMIYKAHLMEQDVPDATKKAVTWIKDKILHCYYMPGLDDKYGHISCHLINYYQQFF